MPGLSVTLVGLVGAAIAILTGGRSPRAAVGWGLAGAWVGFLAGAVVGVAIDVVAGTGVFVAVVGHLGAVGAVFIVLARLRDDRVPRRGTA